MFARIALQAALAAAFTPLLAAQVTPKEKIDLLADPELKGFHFHLSEKNSHSTKREDVASVKDGVLQVTGKGFGYFRTKEAYRDYHLVAEFKWGERTWPKREDRARDCGLLLHCHGPDGSFGGSWISTVQAQMLEGSTGDINVLQGKDADGKLVPSTITIETAKDAKGRDRWKKGGEATTYPPDGKTAASIRWKDRDPEWKDVKGYRGAKDVENPVGEWNRLEVICKGDTVRVILNGVVVNEGRDAKPSAGWIGVQNEWAECFFRRLELWPLGKFTEKWKPQAASTNTGYSETGESILPRRFPFSPEESAKQWRIDGDYELQLVACEPLTCDPVDLAWDEQGRLFVAEMGDYPVAPGNGPMLSRIRLLRDKDGDGRMDAAVTWASGLNYVQGILPMRGGLLATTRDGIIFLKDSDGDDRADVNEPLFRTNAARHNQLQVASPHWGLDNAIYLNNGIDGKQIHPHGKPNAKIDFTGLNLRFDPYKSMITTVTGRGQFGAAQDDFGRRFYCSNRNPVMFAVMPLDAVRRNPKARIAKGDEDIQPSAAPVWPVALSHTTAAAHAGTHTAACGLAVYRGDMMPDLYNNVFVCEPTAQLVTRSRLVQKGVGFTAKRAGEKRDFLVSADEWCRPVQMRNGPDGALYICDMYRRFIDHSMYFPDEFSKTNYMRAGFDHGRIWRLVRKGAAVPPIMPLPTGSASLIAHLESGNAWQRIHSQRLLVEKNDPLTIRPLSSLLKATKSPLARVHALWTLAGIKGLTIDELQVAGGDPSAGVAENALQIATLPPWKQPVSPHPFFSNDGTNHPDPRVRFTALVLDDRKNPRTLNSFRPDDYLDPWMRKAVLSAHGEAAFQLLSGWLRDKKFTGEAEGERIATLREFAACTAANGKLSELAELSKLLPGEPGWWHFAVVAGLSEGLSRGKLREHGTLAKLCADPQLGLANIQRVLGQAPKLVLDAQRSLEDRRAALPLVAQLGWDHARPVLESLLQPTEPVELQAAACRSLSRFKREQVAAFYFDRWNTLGPVPAREAITFLTGNLTTGMELMKRMKAGEINKALMPAITRWVYCKSYNPKIKALARELFGSPDADRGALVTKYGEALTGLTGDPAKGRQVFERAACATCHRHRGTGVAVGPDLADVRIKLPAALLTDILDPNRMVEERWIAYQVETRDERTLVGLVTSESAAQVTLSIPGGVTLTVERADIVKMESTGHSLMPVGIEASITPADMADLIAYLRQP